MKRQILPIAFMTFILLLSTACSNQSGVTKTTVQDLATEAQMNGKELSAKLLGQYEWILQTATDNKGQSIDALKVDAKNPVTITFEEDRYAVLNTCNRIGGSFTLDRLTLVTSMPMSTKMACPDPKMAQLDTAVINYFGEKQFDTELTIDNNLVTLTLKDKNATLVFLGKIKPSAVYGEGVTEFYRVASQLVPCKGVSQKMCLQVKRVAYDDQGIKMGEDAEWSTLLTPINGYEHQEGREEVIRVIRYTDPDPVADGSQYVFYYDMTVES